MSDYTTYRRKPTIVRGMTFDGTNAGTIIEWATANGANRAGASVVGWVAVDDWDTTLGVEGRTVASGWTVLQLDPASRFCEVGPSTLELMYDVVPKHEGHIELAPGQVAEWAEMPR